MNILKLYTINGAFASNLYRCFSQKIRSSFGFFFTLFSCLSTQNFCFRRLIVAGCLLHGLSFSLSGQDTNVYGIKPWRTPSNGGVNVLYCYLHLNEKACDYSELVRKQAEILKENTHTISTLSHLASEYNAKLRPSLLTVTELYQSPMPLIVHIDGESIEKGTFLMLYEVSSNGVNYIDGPTASFQQMKMEDFRRVWSGSALVPGEAGWIGIAIALGGIIVGMCSSYLVLHLKTSFSTTRKVSCI